MIRESLLTQRRAVVHEGGGAGITWYGGGRGSLQSSGIRMFGYSISGYSLEDVAERLGRVETALKNAPSATVPDTPVRR